jgi:hypothetical protein
MESGQQDDDYDPRRRPWYQAALSSDDATEVRWSGPYVFHTLGQPGITASLSWRPAGGGVRVVALDVPLGPILETVERSREQHGDRGFLFRGDGALFLPGPDEAQPPPADGQFVAVHERLGGPLPVEAVAAWRDAGRPVLELVPFESGGSRWWGGFVPLSDRTDKVWAGVVASASAGASVLRSRWDALALTSLGILALAVGAVAVLMRKYSRQLRDLPRLAVDRRDPQSDIYDLIGSGEGTHLEFKSTMRTNLHSGRPGKEIELAWLKGAAAFMNTEGGILLLGIADDGTVTGLEVDGFDNEDRCRLHFKNLLNQHLGAEYARLVRFELYRIDGRQVGVVECERARAPVFLRHKNEERFLIRNGPSNIDLPLSRALKYIRGRFG